MRGYTRLGKSVGEVPWVGSWGRGAGENQIRAGFGGEVGEGVGNIGGEEGFCNCCYTGWAGRGGLGVWLFVYRYGEGLSLWT